MAGKTPQILVVDDVAQNLQTINITLTSQGYRVIAVKSGEQAFKALERIQPDLILLDIVMPGMDGYEVCQRLKQEQATRNIPVIFLTAKSEATDILKGFEYGGVDYITKPFQTPELLARVKTHTELKQHRDLILEYTMELKARTLQLERLNEDKNQFLAIASHDLKNPLSNILTLVKMQKTKPEAFSELRPQEAMAIIERSAVKMLRIIENLLDINRIESGELQANYTETPLHPLVQQVIDSFSIAAQAKSIDLQFSNQVDNLQMLTDPLLLSQILDNLISNAVKYSSPGQAVKVSLATQVQSVCIRVEDQGPGFSEEDQQHLYQKFARLSARPTGAEESTGLGLSIVKHLTEMLGGTISLSSALGQGSVFTLSLPCVTPQESERKCLT